MFSRTGINKVSRNESASQAVRSRFGLPEITGAQRRKEKIMNIRKPTDYSAMYAALDQLMAVDLPQVELYFEIGRAVSARAE